MGKGRVRERGGCKVQERGGCGRWKGVREGEGAGEGRVWERERGGCGEPFALIFLAIKIYDFVPDNINLHWLLAPCCFTSQACGRWAVANNLTLKGHVRASHFIHPQGGCPSSFLLLVLPVAFPTSTTFYTEHVEGQRSNANQQVPLSGKGLLNSEF